MWPWGMGFDLNLSIHVSHFHHKSWLTLGSGKQLLPCGALVVCFNQALIPCATYGPRFLGRLREEGQLHVACRS